jgi:NAD(P)H dehydrogenase (quinone)
VILRNGWYSENYTQSIGAVLQTGAVAGAAEQGKLHTAARKDYAEAAATVLTSQQPQIGKVYELAGDQGFTLEQYAAEISKQSSKHIQYQNMSGSDFSNLLVQVGLPEAFAGVLADSEVQAASGWLADDSNNLSQLIGRSTTPLAESIAAVL